MTRRKVLQACAVIATGILSVGVLRRRIDLPTQVAASWLRPRLDAASPTGSLSDSERETVVAYGEILTVGTRLSLAERATFIEEIDAQTRSVHGYLALYRMTARVLDRLAQSDFAALDVDARTALMLRHDLTAYHVRTRECLRPFRREELTIRALAATGLIAAYYRSAAGWAVVGYDVFPGRCGDPLRYTRTEA